jgi:hypothetical protein
MNYRTMTNIPHRECVLSSFFNNGTKFWPLPSEDYTQLIVKIEFKAIRLAHPPDIKKQQATRFIPSGEHS